MPYPYTFISRKQTVPNRHIAGFPKNVSYFSESAKDLGVHSNNFVSQFSARFMDLDSLSLPDSAVITNVIWPTRNPGTVEKFGIKNSIDELEHSAAQTWNRNSLKSIWRLICSWYCSAGKA